ncbi:MAG: DUF2911 domain-containing protein [Chitinophagales bacterium]|nr:DUF2911 domain-containing protein [Bacteroidota bacterium]MCB9043587.1 DUF2911 domain-containing protein [Chitinophagales bacterium]
MKKIILFNVLAMFLWLSVGLQAQIQTPRPSPLSTLSQKVGLSDVEVTYSRPGVKDRVIFGDLVPLGEMWRAGANASTKIKFSDDVKIEGKDLPKGEYAIYIVPNAKSWDIIFYKDITQWGLPEEYKTEDESLRLSVPTHAYPTKVETFTINVSDIENDNANLEFLWENTQVKANMAFEVAERVQKNIEKVLAGPDYNDYYQAAAFYHDEGKDLDQALEWVNKSIALEPKFYIVRRKALILADMGRYKEAIEAAKQSMAMAQEAGNKDYVRNNEKSIKEWMQK